MPHHQSIARLRKSAEQGCYICKIIVGSPQLENGASSGSSDDQDARFIWTLHLEPSQEVDDPTDFFTYYANVAIFSNDVFVEVSLSLVVTDCK